MVCPNVPLQIQTYVKKFMLNLGGTVTTGPEVARSKSCRRDRETIQIRQLPITRL
jgi:hypothetical protein